MRLIILPGFFLFFWVFLVLQLPLPWCSFEKKNPTTYKYTFAQNKYLWINTSPWFAFPLLTQYLRNNGLNKRYRSRVLSPGLCCWRNWLLWWFVWGIILCSTSFSLSWLVTASFLVGFGSSLNFNFALGACISSLIFLCCCTKPFIHQKMALLGFFQQWWEELSSQQIFIYCFPWLLKGLEIPVWSLI